MKINIKIVEIDQSSHTVLVKYASENSKKSIDEYPEVAFQITNYNVKTPEEFVEAIRPQVSLYVYQRDLAENPSTPVDLSAWHGHTAEVDHYQPTDTALASQLIPAQQNPEIVL
jgi:hypothetical protein